MFLLNQVSKIILIKLTTILKMPKKFATNTKKQEANEKKAQVKKNEIEKSIKVNTYLHIIYTYINY